MPRTIAVRPSGYATGAFLHGFSRTRRHIAATNSPCYDGVEAAAWREENLDDVATIIGIVRDVVLFLLLVVTLIGAIVILKKALSLINTVKRTVDQAEQIVEMLSQRVVKPAASNPRLMRAMGRAVGLLTGLVTKRRSGGHDDG